MSERWECPACHTEYDNAPPFDLGGVCGDCYHEEEADRG